MIAPAPIGANGLAQSIGRRGVRPIVNALIGRAMGCGKDCRPTIQELDASGTVGAGEGEAWSLEGKLRRA